MKKIKIKFFTRGGQYPYQAEGEINNEFFYYRARHDMVSLTLYPKIKEDMVYRDTYELEEMGYAAIDKNSYVTNEEADNDIKTLYNMIKNKANETVG